ncbi:MAG: Fic family protein [Armatimonadota bacterium]|nr:Fic family protein [Armatimonadota bacterium]
MARRPTSRYDLPGGAETQTEPGSRGRVLRNLRGITRKRDMDQAEYEALLRAQGQWLNRVTPATRFTAQTLGRMHTDWLGEIYEWAGKYRSVDVAKGGFTWPPAVRVAENMAAFERGLLARHTPCRPDTPPNVARRMAEVHAELLLIHPYREGNGRLARWLADLMALQAGLPSPGIRFAGRGGAREQERYLAAVTQGYLMRYDALASFFLEALERRLGESSG